MRVKGVARYTHIVNPSAPKNTDKLRWGIHVLIHKTDPQVQAIQAEHDRVSAAGFPSGFPAQGDTCWKDLAITEPENTHLKDYMCLSVQTNVEGGTKPHFVDSNIQPIITPGADSETDGMIVYVEAGIASYTIGSGGIKAYLNGAMVTGEKGPIPREALTSMPDANQMFGDVASATPTPSAAPAANPAPAPAPVTTPPPAPAANSKVMTEKAAGASYDSFIANGWTDAQLVEQGYMIQTSF